MDSQSVHRNDYRPYEIRFYLKMTSIKLTYCTHLFRFNSLFGIQFTIIFLWPFVSFFPCITFDNSQMWININLYFFINININQYKNVFFLLSLLLWAFESLFRVFFLLRLKLQSPKTYAINDQPKHKTYNALACI